MRGRRVTGAQLEELAAAWEDFLDDDSTAGLDRLAPAIRAVLGTTAPPEVRAWSEASATSIEDLPKHDRPFGFRP